MAKKDKKKIVEMLSYPLIGVLVFIFYLFFVNILLNNAVNFAVNKKADRESAASYDLLKLLEEKSVDLLMNIRGGIRSVRVGGNYRLRSLDRVSQDIMIVAIDDESLNKIGRWPFNRAVHKEFTDKITNSKNRENTLFFDIFFVEPDEKSPEDDYLFLKSIEKNDRVVLDYIGGDHRYNSEEERRVMNERIEYMENRFGFLKKVSGTVESAHSYASLLTPLMPYQDVIKSSGVANVSLDSDKVVRRYPLVGKYIDTYDLRFSQLKSGVPADVVYFINYSVDYNGKTNQYRLVRNEQEIFNQSSLPLWQRVKIDRNRIDILRDRIDKLKYDFRLELSKAKGKIERNHRQSAREVIEYLEKSTMEDELKEQIRAVFNNEENLKNTDDFLKELVTNFQLLVNRDKKYEKDLNFFVKLYKACAKVDKIGEVSIIEGREERVNLYDFLYFGGQDLYDDLIIRNEKYVMSIALVLAARYFHVENHEIEVIYGKEIVFNNPRVIDQKSGKYVKPIYDGKELEKIRIPIDRHGYMKINFAGKGSTSNREAPSTFDVHSYYSFIKNKKNSIYIKDKIIMVGAFASGMAEDLYTTPFKSMYGIEVIANTVNCIVRDDYIRYLGSNLYLLILLLFSVIISLTAAIRNIIRAYLYSILVVLLYFFAVVVIFYNSDIVLELPRVLIISILSFMTVTVYRVLTEEKKKKEIKGIFSKYVNASVVEQLLRYPPELGGVDRELTVLFSDIRGFTSLSESLTPQELVELLNEYLTVMTDIILEEDGTLDKYIGDAIMCFWGAPRVQENHAVLACRAALRQFEALKVINERLPEGKKIDVGIGLNSGIMTVGNMGSQGRMNYTIMGDNVNLGSRLEGVNKMYGTNIIISEHTYELVKEYFIIRDLDIIKVKGKDRPVKIYELLAEKGAFLEDKNEL